MRRLIFFSGANKFYGSEIILANLLADKSLSDQFEIYFLSPRNSDLIYGIKEYHKKCALEFQARCFFLNIKSLSEVNKKNYAFLLWPLIIFYLFVQKYYFILLNSVIVYRSFKFRCDDVLFVNNGGYPGWVSSYSVIINAKIGNVNSIFYMVNNLAKGYRSPLRYLDLILDKFLTKRLNFITGSAYAAEKLRSTIGLKNVLSVNTGVVDLYDNESYRKELNLKKDVFYFFCGAIFQERKGHRVLIEAFERFLNKVGKNKIVLILAGEGEILGSIREQVSLKSLESNIVFAGHIVEVGKFLNSVDCLVLASLSDEDFPNIVMEAMSCSLPVIATEVAGIPEQIGDGCGILCKPGSIDDLLDAMLTIYENRNLAFKLGQNSRQKYLSYFTRDKAVNNYVSYIKSTI